MRAPLEREKSIQNVCSVAFLTFEVWRFCRDGDDCNYQKLSGGCELEPDGCDLNADENVNDSAVAARCEDYVPREKTD